MRDIPQQQLQNGDSFQEAHVQNRLQGAALFDLVSSMTADARVLIGSIEIRVDAGQQATPLTWAETIAELGTGINSSQLRDLRADARYAQRFGNPTPLQLAILLFNTELNDHVRDLVISNSVTSHISSVSTRLQRDVRSSRGWLQ